MRGNEDAYWRLASVRYGIGGTRVLLAALRLSRFFEKANFNPNQPRAPRGTREGGRWTREGAGSEPPGSADESPTLRIGDENNALEVPRQRRLAARDRSAAAKRVAIWLVRNGVRGLRVSPLGRALDAATWLYEYAPYIDAYLDAPKSLQELRRAVANPRRGYEKHHIVEADAARRDGFGEALIQSPDNLVLIPTWKHQRITGWYMRRNKEFGWLAPRDYLRGKDWAERVRVGLRALLEAGVMKP